MKKLFSGIAALFAAVGLSAAVQYTENPFGIASAKNSSQNWYGTNYITVAFTADASLWASSYVSNWYSIPDLGSTALMTAGNYGWTDAGGNTVNAAGGETKNVTFTNGARTLETTGYLIGNFKAGDEIGIWLTAPNGSRGFSVGNVGTGKNANLVSRQINGNDLAGNARINFGYNSGSVEFVLTASSRTDGVPTGQPLPGVIASLAVGGALLGAGVRKRARRA